MVNLVFNFNFSLFRKLNIVGLGSTFESYCMSISGVSTEYQPLQSENDKSTIKYFKAIIIELNSPANFFLFLQNSKACEQPSRQQRRREVDAKRNDRTHRLKIACQGRFS